MATPMQLLRKTQWWSKPSTQTLHLPQWCVRGLWTTLQIAQTLDDAPASASAAVATCGVPCCVRIARQPKACVRPTASAWQRHQGIQVRGGSAGTQRP